MRLETTIDHEATEKQREEVREKIEHLKRRSEASWTSGFALSQTPSPWRPWVLGKVTVPEREESWLA